MKSWIHQVVNDHKYGILVAVSSFSKFHSYLFPGSSKLLRLVHEVENPSGSKSAPSLWRHRKPVSIDHLSHTLQQVAPSSGSEDCLLLKEFLRQVYNI